MRSILHSAQLKKFMGAMLLGVASAWMIGRFVRRTGYFDLTDRLVLITGGSRGLGLALAREFARCGADVALCARSERDLAAAARKVRQFGRSVWAVSCDLRGEDQVERLIEAVEETCGPIDMLVNNASTITGPLERMTSDDFRDAMVTNFWAAVHSTFAVIPHMRQRGGGRIINIASIGGKISAPHFAAYASSKFALLGFSSALRTEAARDGILVTTVNPGLINAARPRNPKSEGRTSAEDAGFCIGDALCGLSRSAARAARRIVKATMFGEADIRIALPAKTAAMRYALPPASSVTT